MPLEGVSLGEALPRFNPDTSILRLLINALIKNGNGTFQVEGQTGKTVSYADFRRQSCCISAELGSRGVAAGDLVVFFGDKSIIAYSALLGTMFTGATAFIINKQRAGEFHRFMKNHPVKVVFCDRDCLAPTRQSVANLAKPLPLVVPLDPDDSVMSSFLHSTKDFLLFYVKDVKKHIPFILFTSGSTDDPKGVQLSDFGVQRLGYFFGVEPVKVYLQLSSFSWISSIISFVRSLLKGHTLVLSNTQEPSANLQLIQKYKINVLAISSSMANRYTREASVSSVDLTSLTLVMIVGEVLLKNQREEFVEKVLGGRIGVHNLYGMTETGVVTTWRGKNILDSSKVNSSGCTARGVEIKILDDNGVQLPPGSLGELWVKSESMMVGYWGEPELNSQIFNEEGFFRSGDAGYFDEDGYLYISGRVSDLVNYRGLKISVGDTEDILKSHPAVLECAVVAKPHPEDVNHLVAFVVKKLNTDITADELVAFVDERVANEKKLRGGIRFLDAIPRTTSTKVQRKLLRKMLL